MAVKPKVPKTKPVDDAADTDDEAGPQFVSIEFNGYTFTVPRHRDDWETTAILEFGRARTLDDQIRGLELQLGPDQWTVLTEQAAPKAGSFKQFTDLFFATIRSECVG